MTDQTSKIRSMRITGYKSIRDAQFLLNDLNIMIGPNGAGKSNFVSVFKLLARLLRQELRDVILQQGGIEKILFFGSRRTRSLRLRFGFSSSFYELQLQPTNHGELAFKREFISSDNGLATYRAFNPKFESDFFRHTKTDAEAGKFYSALENIKVFHFHDTSENGPLRQTVPLNEPDKLAADGSNLPAFLFYIQEKYPEAFISIETAIRQIAPFFGEFILRPEALNERLIRLRWRHRGRDEVFDVSDLSDGTVRFIALVALLLQPYPPATIVLDEPELGLHPSAIAHLAAIMHQVVPIVQIIAATQSPTLVSHFGWQDIIVADRDGEASTFRRLEESDVAEWMDNYSMGEIWEKNIIGGRP